MNHNILVTVFIVVSIYNVDNFCNGATAPGMALARSPLSFHKFPLKLNFPMVKRSGSAAEHDNSGDYYEDYYQQEEEECQEGHYWHIRGLMCVPFDCPGGNQFRNKYTGECLLRQYGNADNNADRQMRFVNRMKSQKNKFKLPFGLTLKG